MLGKCTGCCKHLVYLHLLSPSPFFVVLFCFLFSQPVFKNLGPLLCLSLLRYRIHKGRKEDTHRLSSPLEEQVKRNFPEYSMQVSTTHVHTTLLSQQKQAIPRPKAQTCAQRQGQPKRLGHGIKAQSHQPLPSPWSPVPQLLSICKIWMLICPLLTRTHQAEGLRNIPMVFQKHIFFILSHICCKHWTLQKRQPSLDTF